jgi:hypothetical protein
MNSRYIVYLSLVVLIFSFSVGCSSSAIYKPPLENNSITNYSKVVNKSFDETWDALISYSASTFFAIDNFEKASGLITLSFGSSEPERFITGGYWKYDYSYGATQLHFEGDYVKYGATYQNGELNGRMNIVVRKVDESNTKVTVNAKYVYSVDVSNANGVTIGSNTWSFESGRCDEKNVPNAMQGTPPTRKICPTYEAEKSILNSLE